MRGVDIHKTDLRTRYVNYEFVVMYFCIINDTTDMIDLMNRVFRKYLESFVIVFIDDNFVYSKSEDYHMGHLRIVFQLLKDHKLFAKLRNCKVWLRLVDFLVHIVSSVGIEVDPKKTEAVKICPRSLCLVNFQRFWA